MLGGTFFVCGASTNGLIGTHLIAACHDYGIPQVRSAQLLAAMGIFDIIGTTASGWLTDRYSSRHLLFGYYTLRGISLLFLPLTLQNGAGGLGWFAVFYGLDWIATVPPTVRLTGEAFGRENTGVIYGWIGASHQLGASMAAFGAGAIRTVLGDYRVAFWIAGSAVRARGRVVPHDRPAHVQPERSASEPGGSGCRLARLTQEVALEDRDTDIGSADADRRSPRQPVRWSQRRRASVTTASRPLLQSTPAERHSNRCCRHVCVREATARGCRLLHAATGHRSADPGPDRFHNVSLNNFRGERNPRDLCVPDHGEPSARFGHVEKFPRELIERVRELFTRHAHPHDIAVGRVIVGAPQRLLVLVAVGRLRRPASRPPASTRPAGDR